MPLESLKDESDARRNSTCEILMKAYDRMKHGVNYPYPSSKLHAQKLPLRAHESPRNEPTVSRTFTLQPDAT